MTAIMTAAAIIGAALNANGKRAGFSVWLVTNAYWTIHNIRIGEWEQAVLYAVYFGLAVWGYWRKGKR